MPRDYLTHGAADRSGGRGLARLALAASGLAGSRLLGVLPSHERHDLRAGRDLYLLAPERECLGAANAAVHTEFHRNADLFQDRSVALFRSHQFQMGIDDGLKGADIVTARRPLQALRFGCVLARLGDLIPLTAYIQQEFAFSHHALFGSEDSSPGPSRRLVPTLPPLLTAGRRKKEHVPRGNRQWRHDVVVLSVTQ